MRDRAAQLRFAAIVVVLALATVAVAALGAPTPTPTRPTPRSSSAVASGGTRSPVGGTLRAQDPALVAQGRELFAESCSACHGPDGRGAGSRGPSLAGVGAAAVDFMLTTGRMPLDHPSAEPERAAPTFRRPQIAALTAYFASLGSGGPAIPHVDPAAPGATLQRGRRLFADRCSGCHQIVGEGGVGPGFRAPALGRATPTQIGEAIRTGPYVMPSFSREQLSDRDVDAIARFVTTAARHPRDEGGWGIGHIGPIPEGLVAILLGGLAVLGLARRIGERR